MSEHYDFHYQPTGSGAISGQQVLQQTEDAINELGDYVNDNVGGAMDVAQQALETAQNAEQDAQTALDTANSFSGAIQSAQQDASTALSTAQTAQTTASNANNTAIQAQQDANTAVTTANNASGQVSTLSGTVTALGQRVTTAEGNIGQNTSDITALTTRVGTAEGNITTLQNDVSVAMGNASSAMATAGTVKQQAYVFRYSSTALVASSTNSNALLDNTDNLKVGDKVIDSSGVLFSITAIDTANSTFTIGTALVDLATDSDVVHKSGNETIAGVKSFSGDTYVKNIVFTNEVESQSSSSSAIFPIVTTVTYADQSPSQTARLNFRITANGDKSLYPHENNQYALGLTSRKWSEIHGVTYYYGSSDVEFSNKFVTTDTVQRVTGLKTIVGSYLTNEFSNNSRTCVQYVSNIDDSSKSGIFISKFAQGSSGVITRTQIGYDVYSNSVRTNRAFYLDFGSFVNNAPQKLEILSLLTTKNLGSIANKFTSVNTTQINELEPSALAMPDLNNGIDISSYITVTDNANVQSTYTPPSNGWVCVKLSRTSGAFAVLLQQENICGYGSNINLIGGTTIACSSIPVIKGVQVLINSALANGVVSAYFYPCQGNV